MRARALGARTLVTGHYAGIVEGSGGGPVLCEGVDLSKDQSYFLFGVSGAALRDTRFPVGAYTKDEIRELAKEAGLPVAHKPESMETCFVGEDGPAAFVEKVADKLGSLTEEEFYERLKGGTGKGKIGSNKRFTAMAGGDGGVPYELKCPKGHVVTGIRGGEGIYLDSIQLICSPLE